MEFTNVYIKNFSEDIDSEKLKGIFSEFGKQFHIGMFFSVETLIRNIQVLNMQMHKVSAGVLHF